VNIGAIYSMQPDYGDGVPESHISYWAQATRPGSPIRDRHWQQRWPGSFNGGNALLAGALNAQEAYEEGKTVEQGGLNVTHIAMVHNDVALAPGWLDDMVEEMHRTGADLLSVVIPIKDPLGLSSCAIDSDNPFQVTRRITMTEVYDLPESFTAEDCGYPTGTLLVNTGAFLLDFSKPWRKLTNPDGTLKLTFTSPDRVGRRPSKPDGSVPGWWEAQHAPSDWGFSRYLNSLRLKVVATRKIVAHHYARIPVTNEHAWGQWQVDEALKHKFDRPIRNEAYCAERDRLKVEKQRKEKEDGREKQADAA
jgi:hypothetical protein